MNRCHFCEWYKEDYGCLLGKYNFDGKCERYNFGIIEDYKDAAEFDERCLEYIATAHSEGLPCNGRIEDCVFPEERCGWCGIKAARLTVEEEMDG